jgi:hypothetical protein
VGADVEEGAQGSVAAAGDEDVLLVDARGDVAARLGNLADMAGVMPGAVENRRLLGIKDGRVGVEPGRQGVGGLGVGAEGLIVLSALQEGRIQVGISPVSFVTANVFRN